MIEILFVDDGKEREERHTYTGVVDMEHKMKKKLFVNRIFLFRTDKNSLDERLPGNRYTRAKGGKRRDFLSFQNLLFITRIIYEI